MKSLESPDLPTPVERPNRSPGPPDMLTLSQPPLKSVHPGGGSFYPVPPAPFFPFSKKHKRSKTCTGLAINTNSYTNAPRESFEASLAANIDPIQRPHTALGYITPKPHSRSRSTAHTRRFSIPELSERHTVGLSRSLSKFRMNRRNDEPSMVPLDSMSIQPILSAHAATLANDRKLKSKKHDEDHVPIFRRRRAPTLPSLNLQPWGIAAESTVSDSVHGEAILDEPPKLPFNNGKLAFTETFPLGNILPKNGQIGLHPAFRVATPQPTPKQPKPPTPTTVGESFDKKNPDQRLSNQSSTSLTWDKFRSMTPTFGSRTPSLGNQSQEFGQPKFPRHQRNISEISSKSMISSYRSKTPTPTFGSRPLTYDFIPPGFTMSYTDYLQSLNSTTGALSGTSIYSTSSIKTVKEPKWSPKPAETYDVSEHEAHMQALFAATELQGAEKILLCWQDAYADVETARATRKAAKVARQVAEVARQVAEDARQVAEDARRERLLEVAELERIERAKRMNWFGGWVVAKKERRERRQQGVLPKDEMQKESDDVQELPSNDYATWIQNERSRKMTTEKKSLSKKSQDVQSSGKMPRRLASSSVFSSYKSDGESLYPAGFERSPSTLAQSFKQFKNAIGLKKTRIEEKPGLEKNHGASKP